MIDIKTVSKQSLIDFLTEHGEQKFRATQVYQWIWGKGVSSFSQMSNISPKTQELLAQHYCICKPEFDVVKVSKDKTRKYAFRLSDGALVEGVIIPSADRTTACISSQVGCALKCSFCATGTLGYKRNLTAGEIYDTTFMLNTESITHFGISLTNIVVMGMGEPLHNYNNVMHALEMISSTDGMAMSPQRITLSTAGLAPQIKQLADDGFRCNLAVSLHSADDAVRSKIMIINNTYRLSVLQDAISYFSNKTGSRVTLEYLLLKDINDSLDDARALALFCKAFPCKVNIIEYNQTDNSPYKTSTPDKLKQFVGFLESRNMIVTVRASKGKDIDAACGQLVNKRG